MDHDTTNLARLGRQRVKLVAQLGKVDEELLPEVMAAKDARMAEERIANLAGVTRGTIQAWVKKERQRRASEDAANQ